MAFKELNPESKDFPPTLDFVVNVPVTGIYLGAKTVTTRFGEQTLHTLMGDDKEESVFWGSAVLDSKLSLAEPPAMVRINFKGKKKLETGTLKEFSVEIDDEWVPSADDDIPF